MAVSVIKIFNDNFFDNIYWNITSLYMILKRSFLSTYLMCHRIIFCPSTWKFKTVGNYWQEANSHDFLCANTMGRKVAETAWNIEHVFGLETTSEYAVQP